MVFARTKDHAEAMPMPGPEPTAIL